MKIRSLCSAVAPIVVLLAMSSPGRADLIFSNFGPGDTFELTLGYLVATAAAPPAHRNNDIGMAFTVVGSNYTFQSAELALGHVTGSSSINVRLESDAAGLPGGVLESILVTVPDGPSIVTVTSSMSLVLTEGTTYWITTQALDTFLGGWNVTLPATHVGVAGSTDGALSWRGFPGERDAAFRVNGLPSSVPEPGSLALIGMGSASIALVRFRRRRALVA